MVYAFFNTSILHVIGVVNAFYESIQEGTTNLSI